MKRKFISVSLLFGFFVLAIAPVNIYTETVAANNEIFNKEFEAKAQCRCNCTFAKTPILTAGKTNAPAGGTRYSFEPNVSTGCAGSRCSVSSITYSWTVTGTATYTIGGNITNAKKIDVDVTKTGDVTLSCTVTVTCSDGTKCSSTGSKTFKNLKP